MKKQLPEGFDPQKTYTISAAVALLPQLSTSKFTGSVSIDIVFDLNEKQRTESIRGSMTFPHQFGEGKKVAVFANEQESQAAKKAGADIVGLDKLIKDVEAGNIDFEIAIATPTVMPQIAKLGKVLGPKGLMPNPNNQTVTTDLEKVIGMYKAGKTDFKMNEQLAIRAKVAKLDQTAEQIEANVTAFLKAVLTEAVKIKLNPFKKVTLSPTMGKGVKLDVSEVMGLLG